MPQLNLETATLESNTTYQRSLSLASIHGPCFPHFSERSVAQLIEDQVALHPQATAVLCANHQLTFSELNARANQLARHLRNLGVGSESIVGVCMDRSLEMAVSILGILKSGAAYLPLDPDYPDERLAFMLDDAKPALVVAKARLRVSFGDQTKLVLLDQDAAAIAECSDENLAEKPGPADLAYVIYTSGSTGNPKGVMITHGNLANYLLALNHEIGIEASDRYLHTASIAFSSSRRQLLLPLSQGASVVIASADQRKEPIALFRMIKSEGVTVMDAVPSFWRNCTSILSDLPTAERRELLGNRLRLMLSASEPLASNVPRTWMNEFHHSARHVHMFGQTETAGIVSLYHVPPTIEADTYVPVGRPIANTATYVLDENRELCSMGEAGEVYIGGAGVGRGYLNRPELTAEKFIERDGLRLYRSGDWARISPEGRIEFAGRQDQQVKLRGFRVELGEIEAALSQHPAIREGAVVAREDHQRAGDKKLFAYFVPHDGAVRVAELRAFLAERLPDYSVPSVFVSLEALPLSANGKIDRLRLPEPESARANLSTDFIAPQTDTEKRLARIWSEVLKAENIGCEDDFFELGGESLLAAQITARLRREFNFEAPISILFECPTIRTLAHRVASGKELATPQSIKPRHRTGLAPLSFNQQQFWLLNQASPDPAAYNVQTALRISGSLNLDKLQSAIDTLVSRHEILRTNIVIDDGSPAQKIAETVSVAIRFSDLSDLSAQQAEQETEREFAAEAGAPFDLSNDLLLRACLVKLRADEHVMILTLHHIVCDGWSINLLLSELTHLYLQGVDQTSASLPALPIQYADFAVWQREWLHDEKIDRQLNYWRSKLADAPSALDLPSDYRHPAVRSSAGARVSATLPPEICEALAQLSRQGNATLFMTLLAMFQTLLLRYCGQEDVVVGTPVAGRTVIETENLIGVFVNTLVLRSNLNGNPTFREALGRVRETVLGAFNHQDVPFEKLVEELNPERKANCSPLFQVMFSFQNMPVPDLAGNGIIFSPLTPQTNVAKFDLSFDVEQSANGISIALEYACDLYERATIERMLQHFQNLLAAVVKNPDQVVKDLPLIDEEEQDQLAIACNDQRIQVSERACLQQLFEDRAVKTPDAIAAEFRGEQMTYRQLNERANQLAHYLQKHGVGRESLVGICVERSFAMLVAVYGVLKAGGGYVPLDPNYPRERLAFMIDDADMPVIVTQEALARELPAAAKVLCIDRDWNAIAKESIAQPQLQPVPDNVALVIYTSGSTGNPKGVMIEHRSLVNYVISAAHVYGLTAEDRMLQFGSLSFDMSTEEIFVTLSSGGSLVLRTDEMISSGEDFFGFCEAHQISALDLPTAYWHELTDALAEGTVNLPKSIRLVVIGGEKAAADRVARWHECAGHVRLVNSYGPTEITIAATYSDLKPSDAIAAGVVPIGRPLPNTSVYILDESLRLTPTGVPGELYVGGPGVARGYLNRSKLTLERFITNPLSGNPADRLYRTGDIVRYRADGELEFLGRLDGQVKIRGFRVELEEIERVLRNVEGVDDCVVALREDHGRRLVAYIVASEAPPRLSELRNYLKAKLPAYMVPAGFEIIETLPLMPNGKIDRRALPDPKFETENDETVVAPATPIQELLASAWREVLRIERIGVHDNFFDLGGHSLLAAKVVSLVRNELDVPITMVDIFQAPTIATLSELLYPRIAEKESQAELAELLAEIALLSEEEAQLRVNSEIRFDGAAVG